MVLQTNQYEANHHHHHQQACKMLDCGLQKAALIWPGTPENELSVSNRTMAQSSGLMRWMSAMSTESPNNYQLHNMAGANLGTSTLPYPMDAASWNSSTEKLSSTGLPFDIPHQISSKHSKELVRITTQHHSSPTSSSSSSSSSSSTIHEMEMKDSETNLMGSFPGPESCSTMSYHDINNHSIDQHIPTNHSSHHLHQQQQQQQQSSTSQTQTTTATPVISLFKLKNFLYQPKFKNLLHSPEATNGIIHNGNTTSMDQDPSSHQPQSQQQQQQHQSLQSSLINATPTTTNSNNHGHLYSNGSPPNHNRHSNGHLSTGTITSTTTTNSVGQILGLTGQQFKFATNHLQTHSNGTARKYQCKMCPQIFYSKADMQLHTQVHMREAKPYKCSQCSKSFANSSYLSQHTRIHLGIKPYRCEICQRKFTQLSHLQQHIRTHTGDKPYKCRFPNCTKAFSQLSNLQSHSRSHQTDKPFKCNSCYKCFTDEAGLLDHIPKHKESKHLKTHICQFCGKSYTQETYLAKHMQKHADRMETGGKRSRISIPSTLIGQPLAPPPPPPPQPPSQQATNNYWSKGNCQTDCSTGTMIPQVQSQPQQQTQSATGQCLQALENGHRSSFDHTVNRIPMSNISSSASSSGRCDQNDLLYGLDKNGHSPFTPLHSGGVRMSYFSYESFNFPNGNNGSKHLNNEMIEIVNGGGGAGNNNNKKSMEITSSTSSSGKTGHTTTFPNQLIALNQIRNYASMPSSVSIASTTAAAAAAAAAAATVAASTIVEHPISLKDE